MKKILFISILLFLLPIAYSQEYTATIKIIGVRSDGTGVDGNLTVEIQPGKGRILVDTYPLQGIYTQNSERVAVKVASDITKFDFSKYDVIYSISTTGVTNVDGPSAGAAMAVATIAAVQQKQISPSFSITGTIEEDHSIGKVGELFTKARTAANSGVSLFLIPEGQSIQIQYTRKVRTPAPGWRIETIEPYSVDIKNYAKENWGMEVVEVSTIDEALKYAFQEIQPRKGTINYTLPEFSLQFKSPLEKYNDFDSFAKNAIQRGKANYMRAQSKLTSANMPDSIKQDLNYMIIHAKEMIDEADSLLKQGYKYSAGNNGFKASIYSQTVIDLINYYSASENNRELVIDNKISQVNAEIASVKSYAYQKAKGSICDENQIDWVVISIQRITYAENRMSDIDKQDVFNAFFD
ncbi:MAG: S16 family serine protease, partial [Candidatus Aenigmatarchaeota archaeon]